MNKYFAIAILLLIPFLAQAQKKSKIYFYELDVINGLFFQPNTIDPYSGLAYEEHEKGKKKIHIPIKKGKVDGTVTQWEKNGQKVYKAEYEMGTQTGMEKQWYATGAKKLEISYVNGKADGVCTEWFKSKGKKSEGYYSNGKEEGDHYWWYSTGEKDQQVTYKNGLVEGKVFNWYRNGHLKLEKDFQNGKEDGTTIEYFESGQKKSENQFKEGVLNGEARAWSKKGLLLGIQTYEKGVLVNDINYRSGNIHIPGGYLQVFNEKESFFTVKIKSKEVSTRKAVEIIYVVDGMLLELFNNSVNLFVSEEEKDWTDKQILEKFHTKEAQFIRKKTDYDMQVESEWFTTASGQQAIHWFFKSASSLDKEQKPRTVQEEHYVSLVCNKQILNLYGIVTNSDKSEDVAAMLKGFAEQVSILPERIDLNAIVK